MKRILLFAAAAVLSSSIAAIEAEADSRLFSARADQAGVTIDQAYMDGVPLAVAGSGGGATFFRIENPAGAVPCRADFSFVASNGEREEAEVDLCAVNWELTLSLRGAAEAPVMEAEPPLPGGARTVRITTDDPGIGIGEVYLERSPVPIAGRAGNSVEIEVAPGPGGIVCQRDLGVKLSDGRTIARNVNLCGNNFSVLVMLAEDTEPETPVATPPAPVAAFPPLPTPVAPLAGLPPPMPDPGRIWSFSRGGDTATLIYGVPETDDSDFFANCRPGSARATVAFVRAVPGVRPRASISVALSAGAFSKTYLALGSAANEIDGGSYPELSLPASDPLWAALIGQTSLVVAAGAAPPYVLSLSGSAGPTRQFLASCAPPRMLSVPLAVPVPPMPAMPPTLPAPPMPPVALGVPYYCGDGSVITVLFDSTTGTAQVSEPGFALPALRRAPSQPDRLVWSSGPYRLVSIAGEMRWFRPERPPRTCSGAAG